MIYIIHGNDLAKSRTQISNIYQNSKKAQKIELKGSLTSPRALVDAVSSIDIFGNTPFVILEISDIKPSEISEFIPAITKTPKDSTLIILHHKDLGKNSELLQEALKLKASVVVNNKFVKSNIFRFVDYLFLKDRKNTYKELKLLLDDGSDQFYIFSMIIYGLRNIAKIKFSNHLINSKFYKQSDRFTKNEIKDLYKTLYDIDCKTKTGRLPLEIMLNYTIEKILII